MTSAQGGWKAQKAVLEANRDALKQRLAELGFEDPSRARDADPDGLASSLVETFEELEHALGKLRDGSYGRCERCKKEIAPERLQAMPAARFCIVCAARAEATEDATTEYEVDGATQLGIPAFVAEEDESDAHTIQLQVPEHVRQGTAKARGGEDDGE